MFAMTVRQRGRMEGQFELTPGMHAIVGSSGAGKTTLFRLIAGLERHASLKILWNKQTIDALLPHERPVAYVPQHPSLVPHRTIGNQVRWIAKGSVTNWRQWIQWLNLGELLSRYPHQLSGGEQQRAALLRALVAEKPILLLDEALSQIDRPHRLSLYRKLQETLGPEKLLLFSTHQWEDAEQFAAHVVFLKQGCIASSSHVTQTVPVDSEMAFMMGYVGSIPVSDGHLLVHPRTIVPGQNPAHPVHIAGEGHHQPISATLSRYYFRAADGELLLEWTGNPSETSAHFDEISITHPVQVPFSLGNTQGGE